MHLKTAGEFVVGDRLALGATVELVEAAADGTLTLVLSGERLEGVDPTGEYHVLEPTDANYTTDRILESGRSDG